MLWGRCASRGARHTRRIGRPAWKCAAAKGVSNRTSRRSFTAEGDLGVTHYLLHCGGTNDKGELETCWMRVTQCLRRRGSRWLIFHEHFSAPCDMESGNALFD
ncbi:MAG: hypothetical protein E2579_25105 [Pseudomonas sp.]|nr:nuclear transport factor 2 family protein [Pseudomonas sp.]MPT20987.1 hypothetical protein [Pseudomonas sp.]